VFYYEADGPSLKFYLTPFLAFGLLWLKHLFARWPPYTGVEFACLILL